MKRYYPFLITFLYICALILASGYEAGAQPYVVQFPADMHKVPVSDSAGLAAAISNAAPNDLILLATGTYTGNFNITNDGTAAQPIVIGAIGHASVIGGFKVDGDYVYIRDLEIHGGTVAGIDLFCHHCGPINNVIYGQIGNLGIGAWNTGAGQIAYGNIVYSMISNGNNPHNIYSQNNFTQYGYKYFISNVIMDPAQTGNTFLFHAYGQQTYISGFDLEKNILVNGDALIGSWSAIEPDHDEIVKDNYVYSGTLRFGYKRPIWFTATGNYLGRSVFRTQLQWGTPEQVFPELAGATIVKSNTFAFPNGAHILFEAYSYADPCGTKDPACPRKDGVNIRSDNDFDGNTFIPNFTASFWAGGVQNGNVTSLLQWQNLTEAAGKKFDFNSVVNATEPTRQFYIPNEYDDTRGFLVVYNWQQLPAVTFQHAGSLAVYDVKNSFGAPIASGIDTVSIPLAGEFAVFLIKSIPAPPPPPYGLQEIFDDLNACLNTAKTRKTPTEKYRYLRDCTQIVNDKIEDQL